MNTDRGILLKLCVLLLAGCWLLVALPLKAKERPKTMTPRPSRLRQSVRKSMSEFTKAQEHGRRGKLHGCSEDFEQFVQPG